MALMLYSTEGCHLCEQAYELYQSLGCQTPLDTQDIAFDDNLFERYGVTIPVIAVLTPEGQVRAELGWPFDSTQLQAWLIEHGID
ncbi:glutaredoxin family protein [Salinivibrio proteolyticus]|uniref:glutaredoxin family protein n=1 Tax=Salinivibrio proteolyticus TaxID=334715 RepID=UPI000988F04F|nr:glutaredoxin family protein [Salinivibrio proteolyticus]OOF31979.1 NrdH-redoxin [Salinivibrio proteolyticus]